MVPLVPDEAVGPIQNALDQVQMLYAKESQGETAPDQPSDQPPQQPPPSKIWTPGS
jgi:hypothetical protein